MMQVSKRLEKFPEYIFSRLAREVKGVEEKRGKKTLNLSMGSPDFPPSAIYIQKLKEYIDVSGSHLYPGFGASPLFAEALIHWYRQRFHVQIEKNELLPLLGAKDAVSHLPLALMDKGDEILIPDPGYPGFSGGALMMGASIVPYTLFAGDSFIPIFNEIKKKISPKTRMIWVNFPNNPTGQVVSLVDLEPLVKLCKKNNIWLIYDNAYAEMTYDGYVAPSILEIPGAKEIAVEIGSFSKMCSFAGYRMGWIVGNKTVVAALAKVKSQLDSGLSLPLQQMGAYALTNPDIQWQKEMMQSYISRRDILMNTFKKLGLTMDTPKGGLYLWAEIPQSYADSYEYSMELLNKKHIVVTPGLAFGNNGKRFIRISFCSDITNLSSYV